MRVTTELASSIGETTAVSWSASEAMTYDDWLRVGNTLNQIDRSLNWWYGDWLTYGELRWGESYAQAVLATGWKEQRLMNAKWVAGRVQISLRKEILSWTHHSHVARMEPHEQREWLQAAIDNEWSSSELKAAIKSSEESTAALPVPENMPPSPPPTVDDNDSMMRDFESSAEGYDWSPDDNAPNTVEPDEVYTPTKTGGMAVHYSSDTDLWSTPQDLFDVLNAEFGFDTDVCATHDNAKCDHYYTAEDDGLSQKWRGVCWMNPPYGDEIKHWMQKAHDSALRGATVVCLVPARTDTRWWWNTAIRGEIRFIKGRLKFGDGINSAPFPSAVVILRPGVSAEDQHVIWWNWEK